ncbi:MAG: hypothetical protein ABJQ29_17100 [Luteolibacter sp.]
MNQKTPKKKSQPFWSTVISALIVGLIFSLGTTAGWSALVRWLPTEEVAVRITGTESRSSIRVRPAGGSMSYWIEVTDENGFSQNISCVRETYAALTPVGISGGPQTHP